MGSGAGPSTREPYRRAFARLRRDLAPTLDALDQAAADPWALEELSAELPALQYALHAASERARGIDLGIPRAAASDELEAALAAAREETADVAETLEYAGPAAASTLVWEWRVALFAVRLALLELGRPSPEPVDEPLPKPARLPVALLAFGVAGVLGGALASLWPVWVLGLALAAASTALSHRRP